eukprot:COSAG02_NODE_1384_length_12956_cov_126.308446_10_plen_52_part_00
MVGRRTDVIADANAHLHKGRPTAVADSIRSLVGTAMFVVITEPHFLICERL